MLLLNFAHPLTADQVKKIEDITSQPVERVLEVHTQIDAQQPLIPQVVALADQVGFSTRAWQTQTCLVNPPSLNFITAALLAELHGRCGYFVPIVRLRPVAESLPPRYEVAEIINLQAIRDAARSQRKDA